MQGGDLQTKLRDDTSESRKYGWYQKGKFIALGIARGLVYLHHKHVTWFDCQPSNVLLDHTGLIPKVAGLALAKWSESGYHRADMVRSSSAL